MHRKEEKEKPELCKIPLLQFFLTFQKRGRFKGFGRVSYELHCKGELRGMVRINVFFFFFFNLKKVLIFFFLLQFFFFLLLKTWAVRDAYKQSLYQGVCKSVVQGFGGFFLCCCWACITYTKHVFFIILIQNYLLLCVGWIVLICLNFGLLFQGMSH